MNHSISITFGTPEHGWLPVDFHYQDFHLDIDASDALNDPIGELFNAITQIQDNEIRRITWWLEPGAYFFDLEKRGHIFTLTVIKTNDLYNEHAGNTQLIKITGDEKEIIEPFHSGLRQFSSLNYEENHWPYTLDKNKVQSL